MDKRIEALLLTTIALGYKYGNYKLDFDDKYLYDEEVIDCRLKLYWVLLASGEKEQDKKFKEFEKSYKKLSQAKQESIKEHLRKIFEEQDKNKNEKEKRI